MVNPTIISAIVIIIALWSVIPACCWLGSSKKIWMPAFAGMTAMLSIICFINPSFATTSHNLYDAKGNLMASCGDNGCEYFIYQGVSRVGVVKEHQFTHQANGLGGKAGEMVRDQSGVINSQLWVTDFHGSVVAKLTSEESDSILFDAFGSVLNESTNTEDRQDYHYTDKPRVGCAALHNFNARFYDPKLGRFTITDPVEQHHLNWFMYGNNNPLSFVDTDGRQAKQVIKTGLKYVAPEASAEISAASAKISAYFTLQLGRLAYAIFSRSEDPAWLPPRRLYASKQRVAVPPTEADAQAVSRNPEQPNVQASNWRERISFIDPRIRHLPDVSLAIGDIDGTDYDIDNLISQGFFIDRQILLEAMRHYDGSGFDAAITALIDATAAVGVSYQSDWLVLEIGTMNGESVYGSGQTGIGITNTPAGPIIVHLPGAPRRGIGSPAVISRFEPRNGQ